MKVLINPLAKDITIQYGGKEYTVRKNSYLKFTEENEKALMYWKTQIHQFLKIKEMSDNGSMKEEPKEELKKEIKEDIKEKKEEKVEKEIPIQKRSDVKKK